MTSRDARFVELYEQFYGRVHAYCRRRLESARVDDAVAETFLTAWRKIEAVPDGESALPWLYAVAHRVVGHQWRTVSRTGRLREKLGSLGVTHVPPADDIVVVGEEATKVMEALSRLRASEQEVLRLSVWEDLDHTEISEVLAISYDAVKKRYSRAKKNLAQELNRAIPQTSPAAQEGGAW